MKNVYSTEVEIYNQSKVYSFDIFQWMFLMSIKLGPPPFLLIVNFQLLCECNVFIAL